VGTRRFQRIGEHNERQGRRDEEVRERFREGRKLWIFFMEGSASEISIWGCGIAHGGERDGGRDRMGRWMVTPKNYRTKQLSSFLFFLVVGDNLGLPPSPQEGRRD
jgi:hypothetical protein